MWAAREKNGCIYVYQTKPLEYLDGCWKDFGSDEIYSLEDLDLSEKDFELVTYKNSPVEFSCKPIFKYKLLPL